LELSLQYRNQQFAKIHYNNIKNIQGAGMKLIMGIISFLFFFSIVYAEDIKLSYRGGVYHTPVTLNNSVRLEFVVDSGAASVYMPDDVFRTLIRTGTISKADILGTGKSETASGEIIEDLRVNIRELKIGSQRIYNVKASVGGENASLLLGQSALEKLEPWSLNTRKKILTIKSRSSGNYSYEDYTTPSSTTDRQILTFIDDYISRGNSRDLKGVMDLYANRVNYFRADNVSKDFIYKDKKKYYKRWPSMQVEFIKINNIERYGNERTVTYTILFDVYNYAKRKGIRGKAINTVILKNINGSLKIISDKQKVLSRQKY
jgi:hypothetical protein